MSYSAATSRTNPTLLAKGPRDARVGCAVAADSGGVFGVLRARSDGSASKEFSCWRRRLRGHLSRLAIPRRNDSDDAAVEVDCVPGQSAQLTAAQAGETSPWSTAPVAIQRASSRLPRQARRSADGFRGLPAVRGPSSSRPLHRLSPMRGGRSPHRQQRVSGSSTHRRLRSPAGRRAPGGLGARCRSSAERRDRAAREAAAPTRNCARRSACRHPASGCGSLRPPSPTTHASAASRNVILLARTVPRRSPAWT